MGRIKGLGGWAEGNRTNGFGSSRSGRIALTISPRCGCNPWEHPSEIAPSARTPLSLALQSGSNSRSLMIGISTGKRRSLKTVDRTSSPAAEHLRRFQDETWQIKRCCQLGNDANVRAWVSEEDAHDRKVGGETSSSSSSAPSSRCAWLWWMKGLMTASESSCKGLRYG